MLKIKTFFFSAVYPLVFKKKKKTKIQAEIIKTYSNYS